MTIDSFRGGHAFLSNFAAVKVRLDGVEFPTVEHAYMAAKTIDPRHREWVRGASTPGKAKRMGRQITLRADWEDVKLQTMEMLLQQKCSQEPFRSQLDATGDALLVEGNTWGDRFWGVCRGEGENHLGKLLMKIRAWNREARLDTKELR